MDNKIKVIEENDSVIVHGIKDFCPKHIFECGQCFRWEIQSDGSYTGVAYGRVINVNCIDSMVIIKNTNLHDFNSIWRRYFDLDEDYSRIKEKLRINNYLIDAIEFGWGIRILKQEMWECLISFIISSNNIIPRIKKIINSICNEYGDPIYFNGKTYYSFPGPKVLSSKTMEELSFCKSGYRCSYILKASQMVCDKIIDLRDVSKLDTDSARRELVKIPGIGPKIADCILLFSMDKYDVFPADVWIKRIMKEINTKSSFPENLNELAGYAQQYLYYYAREMKIGKN